MITHEVVISKSARNNLHDIYQYLSTEVSEEYADQIRDSLIAKSESLNSNPERFPREPWIQLEGCEIRFALHGLYKVIFEIKGKEVHVLKFFHTRRDPKKMLDDD